MTAGNFHGSADGSGSFLRTVFMCFDWRVLAGFGVLDLGLLIASPQLAPRGDSGGTRSTVPDHGRDHGAAHEC